jgi:hypothetical protein
MAPFRLLIILRIYYPKMIAYLTDFFNSKKIIWLIKSASNPFELSWPLDSSIYLNFVFSMQYFHTNETSLQDSNAIDNYQYVAFVISVFLAPILFITVLCYIQARNRRLRAHEVERVTNRRLSV